MKLQLYYSNKANSRKSIATKFDKFETFIQKFKLSNTLNKRFPTGQATQSKNFFYKHWK